MMRNIPANAMFFPGNSHSHVTLWTISLSMSLTVIFTDTITISSSYPSTFYIFRTSYQQLSCHVIAVNELVKSNVASFRNKSTDNLSMPERLFAGACAGLCYWVGTFPLDAIKVRTYVCLIERTFLSFKRTPLSNSVSAQSVPSHSAHTFFNHLSYSTSFKSSPSLVSDSSLRTLPFSFLVFSPLHSSPPIPVLFFHRQGSKPRRTKKDRDGLRLPKRSIAKVCSYLLCV